MTLSGRRQALFEGLVFNENNEPADVFYVGDEPNYVILDAGFRRHVASEHVDRQVLRWLQEQVFANRELVTEGMLAMLGKDDLFTKAMIDASIQNMDRLIEQGLPDDARTWLGMFGFRIIVDIHGDVIRTELPAQEAPDEYLEPVQRRILPPYAKMQRTCERYVALHQSKYISVWCTGGLAGSLQAWLLALFGPGVACEQPEFAQRRPILGISLKQGPSNAQANGS